MQPLFFQTCTMSQENEEFNPLSFEFKIYKSNYFDLSYFFLSFNKVSIKANLIFSKIDSKNGFDQISIITNFFN